MPGVLIDLIAKDYASPSIRKVSSSLDAAAASTARMSKAMDSSVARMGSVGATLTKRVTLPILAIGAASATMAAQFQKQTNVLVTAAGETAANLGKVRSGILDIAETTGTGWKDVTSAVYVAEKAGYRGAAALQLVKAAAQGAREENANLSTVLDAQTSLMQSWHVPASQSVQVVNELKTAAGSAKTSMELFAGSLSTVAPLASANKISIADMLGSLASLTQHGTSPDEAAQELANTVRNLAAPNQVAIKTLAQLGVSSVDVATKLRDGPGGRGLAGTLNYLAEVVKSKTGPSGTLMLSTLNASKVAASDANIEFNKLAPATQKLAKGFIDGSITQKEWMTGVKALSPEQANLARQFATTENTARGFQQQLRNGTSTTLTASDALKAITGGANGLNTVLQLTGESAAGTNMRIKDISAAAQGAGKDVSGWASTQKLAAVQLDILKQKVQATGIEIGTSLLPPLTKVIGVLGDAVTGFQHLSSTDKTALAWSAGIAFAIGPVLSIGTKLVGVGAGITKFTTATISQMARFNTGLALNAEGVSTAIGRVTAAVGGAGIGLAVGTLTQNASAATKSLGILGSAAAGAALGFGSGGGPLGAGIGAVAGALTAAVSAFHLFGSGAKSAIKPTSDFTSAIQADNDAIGKNTQLLAANALQKAGAYTAGSKLGLATTTVLGAATGDLADQQAVRAAIIANGGLTNSVYGMTKAQLAQKAAADQLANSLGVVAQTLQVNKTAAQQIDSSLGKTKSAIDNVSKTPLKVNTAQARVYIATLQGEINAIKQGKVPLVSADSALGRQQIASLQAQINALQQGNPPSITANIGPAMSQLNAIQNKLNNLHGVVALTVDQSGVRAVGGRVSANAAGTGPGGLPDGFSTVGESSNPNSWELVHKSGSLVQVFSNAQSRAMTGMHNVPGFASGTSKPTYTVGGVTYTTQRAAQDARIRLATQLNNLRIKINGSDLDSLRHALTSTAYAVQQSFNTLIQDFVKAGGQAVTGVLSGLRTQLLGIQAQTVKAQTLLTDMQNYRGSIVSTLSGSADFTKAGSVTDLVSSLNTSAGTNRAYGSELTSLRAKAKGNSALLGFINQLAASGQTTTLATLASASKGDLVNVTKALSSYDGSLAVGADAATAAKYNGRTVDQQQAVVKRDQAAESKALAVIGQLVKALGKPEFRITLDGKEIAAHVTNSKEMAHLLAELEHEIAKGVS